ncbi:tetratricopeptide repeat protein [Candidatus Thiodictyon syntrophicum]|jgi:tetratricopeptide (TPR) repeat protein|nr:tetratricopeptide repeat protein [Candidatus Thiodictyon syntrophicum]
MAGRPIVETFNTHRMRPEVVRALATGRERELADITAAIRQALGNPGVSPQHLVVYGERGSGKSFLMRLVQLEAESLAAAAGAPVVVALLPEEQYNIRSEARLIEALAASLEGLGSTFSYAYDPRAPQVAWEEALETLNAALDRRFGPGRGLLVAAIENFDGLSKTLFGAGKDGKTRIAAEQRCAEERLRQLMSRPQSRLMLLVTATGTVDMDYERPLFQAFKTIELTPWTSDTCIDYFNRRRELEQAPPLTAAETARARAIAAFIGGNPRLTQLLGEVLVSPDARTIAETLDALSDQLADYYRRRLDDLPPAATGLLDALIRQGEPCSQSELAARVNQRQNQIADAFGYLNEGRLLLAEREKGGASQLYRVRDRLFVHFYRRRYGDGSQANALARIAELLETFFTADEKADLALRHLRAGEPREARLYIDLWHKQTGESPGHCGYRDQDRRHEPCLLFMCANVAAAEMEVLREQLRDRPEDAYVYWSRVKAQEPLARAAAAGLHALAASRCDHDAEADRLLQEAQSRTAVDVDPDAGILLLHQRYFFAEWRRHDRRLAVALAEQAGGLASTARYRLVKIRGLLCRAWAAGNSGHHADAIAFADEASCEAGAIGRVTEQATALRYKGLYLGRLDRQDEALDVLDQAYKLAQQDDDLPAQAGILNYKAYALRELGRPQDAILGLDQAFQLAEESGDVRRQGETLRLKGWILGRLGQHQEALSTLEQAAKLAEQAGDINVQALIQMQTGWSLGLLGRHEEAIATLNRAAPLAEQAGNISRQAEILCLNAWSTWKLARYTDALECARAAIRTADESADTTQQQRSRRVFFKIAAETPAPDLVKHLAAALTLSAGDPRWLSPHVSDIMAATTQARLWPELAVLIETHREQFKNARVWRAFGQVGPVWAVQAKAQGRAAAFAAVARDLPTIAQVMAAIPSLWFEAGSDPGAIRGHDLFDGLVGACDDPGLLGDIADLIPAVFGPESAEEAARLRTFAAYHAAPDKAAFLQRCDPDLAIAIRRIWAPAEPEGRADRGGRSKR